jgi:hypothetical protein
MTAFSAPDVSKIGESQSHRRHSGCNAISAAKPVVLQAMLPPDQSILEMLEPRKEMTDLVMLHVLLSSEQMADLERYREREGKRSKKEAARELIALGLRAAQASEGN